MGIAGMENVCEAKTMLTLAAASVSVEEGEKDGSVLLPTLTAPCPSPDFTQA